MISGEYEIELEAENTEADIELEAENVTIGGTDSFDRLKDRPKYDGNEMTSATDIPNVDDVRADLTAAMETAVSTLTTEINKKVNSSELATVARTGEYDDLENEPEDFTQEEWTRLWAEY